MQLVPSTPYPWGFREDKRMVAWPGICAVCASKVRFSYGTKATLSMADFFVCADCGPAYHAQSVLNGDELLQQRLMADSGFTAWEALHEDELAHPPDPSKPLLILRVYESRSLRRLAWVAGEPGAWTCTSPPKPHAWWSVVHVENWVYDESKKVV